MQQEIWNTLERIYQRERNIRILADARQRLRRKEVRWRRLLILSLVMAAILAAAVGLERMHKAHGLTHADRVELNRLVDSLD